jgi:hypothetical protein
MNGEEKKGAVVTPKALAAEYMYDVRNRAKDALMHIENAVHAFENDNLDRAEVSLGQAVQPADLLTMLIEDARRKLRAVARPA